MRSRAGRFLVLVILLASGGGAAWSSWDTSRQTARFDRSQRDLNARVDHLGELLDSVTTAEQTYVRPAPDQDFSRVPELLGRLRSESDGLRPHVRSLDGGRALQAVGTAAATLQDIETRAQEHLRAGQDLMAADLIVSEGRSTREAIATGLRTLRTSENDWYTTARADAVDVSWSITGGAAALWVIGLILLMRVPSPVVRAEVPAMVAEPSPLLLSEPVHQTPPPSYPDLPAAAEVCTTIGRLKSAEDLPQLLQQAAAVVDASGIVVWMAAGEELFAAAAYGYPPHVVQKLGPINRSAINATAAAWRSGTLQTVAGDLSTRGALAAPMLGPDRCIGVLAVEISGGREDNPGKRAVTVMFAAQLGAALAAWPAASAAASEEVPPPLERAAEG
jgi:GAF domain-containing protein